MTTFKSTGQVALDNQASEERAEAVRKSEERTALREQLLAKLSRPTKISKAESQKSVQDQILETLQQINAKLGDPAIDNARYLTARSMGVDPGRGKVPMAPHQDHLNAGDAPDALIETWLRGKIL